MKTRGHLVSIIVAILIASSGVAAVFLGARPKLGLDLTGGLSVILTAKGDFDPEVLDQTVEIIRSRVDSLGTTEPEISRAGDENIIVQLPQIDDPDRALEIIGKTAQLRFRPVMGVSPPDERLDKLDTSTLPDEPDKEVQLPGSLGDQRVMYQLGAAAVEGADVKDAYAQVDTTTGQWMVQLELTRDGAKKFGDITTQLAPQTGQLAIVLDKQVESAPQVQQAITNGQAQITGSFSENEAKDLALVLRAGALPVTLEASQVQKVSATLGSASLKAGLIAGMIGLGLVVLYMLFMYRLLGLQTVLGLILFGGIITGIIGLISATRGFTLTLAGIAGLIVSVGIAADSYIIFFERIKDELRLGKTYRSSVERAFVSAFRTNLAGNSVAFAAAITLYLLAVGPVRGFALTLGISVLVDIALLRFWTYPVVALIARRRKNTIAEATS